MGFVIVKVVVVAIELVTLTNSMVIIVVILIGVVGLADWKIIPVLWRNLFIFEGFLTSVRVIIKFDYQASIIMKPDYQASTLIIIKPFIGIIIRKSKTAKNLYSI
jgi:hypothetical protein